FAVAEGGDLEVQGVQGAEEGGEPAQQTGDQPDPDEHLDNGDEDSEGGVVREHQLRDQVVVGAEAGGGVVAEDLLGAVVVDEERLPWAEAEGPQPGDLGEAVGEVDDPEEDAQRAQCPAGGLTLVRAGSALVRWPN